MGVVTCEPIIWTGDAQNVPERLILSLGGAYGRCRGRIIYLPEKNRQLQRYRTMLSIVTEVIMAWSQVIKVHCGAKKLHHFIFAITLSKRLIVK